MKSRLGDESLPRPGIDNLVTLEIAKDEDLPRFKKDLQEAFAVALIEEFGSVSEPIPSDADMERSFEAPGSVVYRILADGRWVGGAVLTIDGATHHNALALFYISVKEHSRGIGQKAWKAIEERYPETKVWETHTPYFERRNIHFYVNKCGFKIVAYYNAHNPDPHDPDPESRLGDGGMFKFEKIM
jgi:hypothetical protein